MRILYAAMKYDYGKPEQGLSFEHYNFYHSLLHMGHDILYFDYMTLMRHHGRDRMNQRLKEVVALEKPDLLFTVLFTDQFDPLVLRELTDGCLPTVNWFCDDHWRFDNYSSEWAPCFKWVITTAASALPKYEALRYRNVIKSQWACNHALYRKLNLPLRYDVTFVGQPHGSRRQVIQDLRNAGIKVRVWGGGWESGRITQDEMIRVFNQSRINLNLSNSSMPVNGVVTRINAGPAVPYGTIRSRVSRVLDTIPLGSRVKAVRKAWLKRTGHAAAISSASEAIQSGDVPYSEQIKGRNFEVPGCGGFLLTGRADNLDQYYESGKDIASFTNTDELIERILYYLKHESERAAIARAGYERTLREHTYVQRFRDIFRQMGMPESSIGVQADPASRPGCTQEVA